MIQGTSFDEISAGDTNIVMYCLISCCCILKSMQTSFLSNKSKEFLNICSKKWVNAALGLDEANFPLRFFLLKNYNKISSTW